MKNSISLKNFSKIKVFGDRRGTVFVKNGSPRIDFSSDLTIVMDENCIAIDVSDVLNPEIIIWLDSGMEVDIECENNIDLIGISLHHLNLQSLFGNIKITNSDIDEFSVQSVYGNIYVISSNYKRLHIGTSNKDIYVLESFIDDGIYINTLHGDVKFINVNVSECLDVIIDAGDGGVSFDDVCLNSDARKMDNNLTQEEIMKMGLGLSIRHIILPYQQHYNDRRIKINAFSFNYKYSGNSDEKIDNLSVEYNLSDEKELHYEMGTKEKYDYFTFYDSNHKADNDLSKLSKKMYLKDDFIVKQIKKNSSFFKDLDIKYRGERNIALEAVVIDGLLLEYISDDLKADIDVVMAALESNPMALEFADDNFKDDDDIVKNVISRCGKAIQFASQRIKKIKEFALLSVKNDGLALKYIPDFMTDKDAVLEAIKQNGNAIKYADNSFYSDKEIMLIIANKKESVHQLMFGSEEVRSDKKIILTACRIDRSCIKYATPRLRDEIRIDLIKLMMDDLFVDYEIDDEKKMI